MTKVGNAFSELVDKAIASRHENDLLQVIETLEKFAESAATRYSNKLAMEAIAFYPTLRFALAFNNDIELSDYALAACSIYHEVFPKDLNIIKVVIETFLNRCDYQTAIAAAENLQSKSVSIVDRIVGEHLLIKASSPALEWRETAIAAYDRLRELLHEFVAKPPELNRLECAVVSGTLFWLCGYFDDDRANRALINQVSAVIKKQIRGVAIATA